MSFCGPEFNVKYNTIATPGGEVGITHTMESPEVYSKKDDRVIRGEDIMNNQEETMISSPSPSYDNLSIEPTVSTQSSSFDHHQYEQNYQQQREERAIRNKYGIRRD